MTNREWAERILTKLGIGGLGRMARRQQLADLLADFAAEQTRELREEHQSCLDGDEAWAAKWKRTAEAALARIRVLEEALREFAENWDHDEDAHRYNTRCRVCVAESLLAGAPPQAETQKGRE